MGSVYIMILLTIHFLGSILSYGYSVAWFENEYKCSRDTWFDIVMNRIASLMLGIVLGPFALLFLYFNTDHMKRGWKM